MLSVILVHFLSRTAGSLLRLELFSCSIAHTFWLVAQEMCISNTIIMFFSCGQLLFASDCCYWL